MMMRSQQAWVAVALALALRAIFAVVSLRAVPANTDECNIVLTAKRIAEGERPLLLPGQPYQFPAESYVLAPFVHWLPRNAVGARAHGMVAGFVSLGLFILLMRRSSGPDNWPGLLLLLFPSAYWVITQVGIAMPGFATFGVLCPLMLLGLLEAPTARHRYWLLAAAGLCGGLSASAHMVVLPLLLAATLVAVLRSPWHVGLRQGLAFGVGLVLGLTPYLLAQHSIAGAHAPIVAAVPWRTALRRLWNPLLTFTLPGAMGIPPVLYPDFRELLGAGGFLRGPFLSLYLVTVAATLAVRAPVWWRQLRGREPFALGLPDLMLGATAFTLALFAASARSLSHAYRYLIVAVWAWPFLCAYLHTTLVRAGQRVVLVLAAGLAAVNVVMTTGLIATWRAPNFAARVADLPDLRPLLTTLRANGVTHCYASMWLASRINYESDEAIVCSPPYNERFAGWPLPYKARVDASARTPFILTETHQSRFKPDAFEQDLQLHGVFFEKQRLGVFHIYDAFDHARWPKDVALDAAALRFSASHNAPHAVFLGRECPSRVWSSEVPQTTEMWVQADWPQLRPAHRITLYYDHARRQDRARHLRIRLRQEGSWLTAAEHVPPDLDRLRYVPDHPVYGGVHQTIWLDEPIHADAVRLEIQTVAPGQPWTIAEIEIGCAQGDVKG